MRVRAELVGATSSQRSTKAQNLSLVELERWKDAGTIRYDARDVPEPMSRFILGIYTHLDWPQ